MTECNYPYGWIKEKKKEKKMVTHTHKKKAPKMVNPRDIAGNAEGEELESAFIRVSELLSTKKKLVSNQRVIVICTNCYNC